MNGYRDPLPWPGADKQDWYKEVLKKKKKSVITEEDLLRKSGKKKKGKDRKTTLTRHGDVNTARINQV